ncbi:hypothetical protein AVEN_47665-1 [Araneus ventricosus]|uniref:Uncharacterized protein n=1 Tax=Araneus ventricosus TaxID=182803 RepID=A0A4Y2U805_ARAVE|nr:hypothetical protein AVEN_47665-1 [Araneus ventricosus]
MVWRRKNEELNPKNLVGTVKYGHREGVLVWGFMSASELGRAVGARKHGTVEKRSDITVSLNSMVSVRGAVSYPEIVRADEWQAREGIGDRSNPRTNRSGQLSRPMPTDALLRLCPVRLLQRAKYHLQGDSKLPE